MYDCTLLQTFTLTFFENAQCRTCTLSLAMNACLRLGNI